MAVVTKPFSFEGAARKTIAESALQELEDAVDTVITIQNDRLLQIIDKKTSLLDAFNIVDDVLRQGVQGISELITVPGLINVDFADVKSIMKDQGGALMGIGSATGDSRAVEAAKAAISSPLLDISMDGAKGILFIVGGNSELSMHEVNEAAKVITDSADTEARIIFGTVIDEDLGDELKITVIATGFDGKATPRPMPERKSVSSFGLPQQEEQQEEEKKQEEPAADKSLFGASKQKKEAPVSEPPKKKEDYKAQPHEEGEEDLDIPAFIRKKMG